MAFSVSQLEMLAKKGNKSADQILSKYNKKRKLESVKQPATKKTKPQSKVPLLIAKLELAGIKDLRWSGHNDGEYIFHPRRRWRLDVYHPESKVAVEVEGGIRSHGKNGEKSRHLQYDGFTEDAIKYFEAGKLGIWVIRVSSEMVRDDRAACMFIQAIEARGISLEKKNAMYRALREIINN